MAKTKKYYVTTRYKSCPKWDRWFTKWEMRCFGWFYKGLETEASNIIDVEVNWDTGKATASRRFYEWITFKRVNPYTGNILFKLCETIMSFFSWLRRKLVGLLGTLLLVGFVIAGVTTSIEELSPYLLGGVGAIFGIYCVSSVIAIVGNLLRRLFNIEGKLKESLAQNGYSTELDS